MRASSVPSASLLVVAVLLPGCAASPHREASPEAAAIPNGSHTAELNGFSIHYEVHGRGPVLMTLPNSWGLTLEGLRALYRPLEQHLTLVYFDPRGMGGSGPVREDPDMGMAAVRADFDALRRHLGLGRVNAIGWSNGAMNLLLLAAERPETLASATFLHGTASFTEEDARQMQANHPEVMERYQSFQAEMQGLEGSDEEMDARMKRFVMESWTTAMFADAEAGIRVLPQAWSDVGFSWRHYGYAQAEAPAFDARDRLASITMPCLVLAGAHDLMPPEKAEEIHRGVPDSRFVVLEHSGHFAPLEEPALFQEALLRFLRSVEPSGGSDEH